MKKSYVVNYITKNFWHIFLDFLLVIYFRFVIYTDLIKIKSLESIFKTFFNSLTFKILIPFLFITLIYSFKNFLNAFKKFLNKFELKKPNYTLIDHSIVILTFFFISILIKPIAFLLAGLLIIVFFIIKNIKIKKSKKEMKETTLLISDNPITKNEEDMLDRGDFVKSIYEEIKMYKSQDSFVFGLVGEWGEGKTSVLNLLINKFKKENDKEFIIINFNPWYFKDEESILKAFYGCIAKEIQKIYPVHIEGLFVKYLNLILYGLLEKKIGLKFHHKESESVEEIKKKLEDIILNIDKKLIIIIDDIDRLEPDKIFLILKTVNLNANFKNTIFILSFDDNYVVETLKNKVPNPKIYLEKIIQKIIYLPKAEDAKLDKYFEESIKTLMKQIKLSSEQIEKFWSDFSYIYNTQIKKLYRNLRHIKRYVNSLTLTLPPLKNEINLSDLLIMEIIKVFYPSVFNDIKNYWWFYIPTNWSSRAYLSSPFRFVRNYNDKKQIIKKHIKEIVQKEDYGEVLEELLKKVFLVEVDRALEDKNINYDNVASSYRAEKRITHPEVFEKYFMLKIPSDKLSDEFIESTIEIWNSVKEEEIEQLIENTIFEIRKENKLIDFIDKLEIFIDRIIPIVTEKLIKVIYTKIDKFSDETIESPIKSDFFSATKNFLLTLINEKYDKEYIQQKLEDVILNTPSFSLAVSIVLSCQKDRSINWGNIYSFAQPEILQEKLSQRLKKHFIDEQRDIFEEINDDSQIAFILYQWATNWMTFKGDNKTIVESYIFSLIRNDIKKFLRFIKCFKNELLEISKICNLEEILNLAENFKNNTISILPEESHIIESFIKQIKTEVLKSSDNEKHTN